MPDAGFIRIRPRHAGKASSPGGSRRYAANGGSQHPARQPSLRTNFCWVFAGNLVYAATQWGLLAALTKLGTPELVGSFAVGLAITAPIFMFSALQLRAVQATDAGREYLFSHYLGLAATTGLLGLLATAIVAAAGDYRPETRLVIVGIGAAKACELISETNYGYLQQRERMAPIATSLIARGTAGLILLVAGLHFTGSLVWGVAAMALGWAAMMVFYDFRNTRLLMRWEGHTDSGQRSAIMPRWDKTTLKLARQTIPLGLVSMLFSLNANVPRYFIEHYQGEHMLGLFTPLAYFAVAGNTLAIALGHAASPVLARHYVEGNRSAFRVLLSRVIGICTLFGALGVAVAVIWGSRILALLYSAEYSPYVRVFVLLMISAAIAYGASILNCGIIAARFFKSQTALAVATAAVTVVACFLLVPPMGMYGAGVAQVIASAFQFCAGVAVVGLTLRKKKAPDALESRVANASDASPQCS